MKQTFNSKMKMDHIERLIRGKRSGINIGSRSIGHHLNQHELEDYKRALSKGFLELDVRARENLWNVWEKVCFVKGWDFYILEKDSKNDSSVLYLDRKEVSTQNLSEGKKLIKEVATS